MLRSPRDFAALQQLGRSRTHRLVTVRTRRNDLDRDRYGIATGRKLGKAVVRNRVRRRVRDILRRLDGTIESGRDILVVARPDSASASFVELAAALGKLLGDGPRKEGMRSSVKRLGIGLIHLYRSPVRVASFALPVRAQLLALHRAGDRSLRPR